MTERDELTERYFEENTPAYSLGRYERVIEFLRNDAPPSASLLDIGCGSGNVLKLISESTSIGDLAGVDVSPAYLAQCGAAVPGCKTYRGSILDPSLIANVGRGFRYVIVGAVLHHLVGGSRNESMARAWDGLAGSWSLVEAGGALVVMEPTFGPHRAMSLVFHAKRLTSAITSRRLSLFGYWNNLGEPIVSYLSHEELLQLAGALPDASIARNWRRAKRLPAIWRLAGINERADSVLVVRKAT